jgi:hypothetical protein
VPKVCSFSSAASASSSQADCTDGRLVVASNQETWVSGSVSQSTNAQAVSRFSVSLKTARLDPPTNEEDEPPSGTGIGATSYFDAKPSPPMSSTSERIHGPEMNIGTVPLVKSASVCPSGGEGLAMPSVKKLWKYSTASTVSGVSNW